MFAVVSVSPQGADPVQGPNPDSLYSGPGPSLPLYGTLALSTHMLELGPQLAFYLSLTVQGYGSSPLSKTCSNFLNFHLNIQGPGPTLSLIHTDFRKAGS